MQWFPIGCHILPDCQLRTVIADTKQAGARHSLWQRMGMSPPSGHCPLADGARLIFVGDSTMRLPFQMFEWFDPPSRQVVHLKRCEQCTYEPGIDMVGHDIKTVELAGPAASQIQAQMRWSKKEHCASVCQAEMDCTFAVWLGNHCYLKSAGGERVKAKHPRTELIDAQAAPTIGGDPFPFSAVHYDVSGGLGGAAREDDLVDGRPTSVLQNSILRIRAQMKLIRQQTPKVRAIMILNSGLHDVNTETCFRTRPCVTDYAKNLRELISAANQTKPDLIVYRTTNAAWPKWGNWGFSWPNRPQEFVASNFFLRAFGKVERAILRDFPNVKIIDGYDMTLPRADHTERSKAHEVGPHMAHHGPQVVELQNMLFKTLVLEHFCPSILHAHQARLQCDRESEGAQATADCGGGML
eukprot:COSAG01_NODE_6090_length_3856_cov_6.761778_2_plen_411_part_00